MKYQVQCKSVLVLFSNYDCCTATAVIYVTDANVESKEYQLKTETLLLTKVYKVFLNPDKVKGLI